MYLVGIDFSSHAIDAAIIPTDPDAGLRPLTLRRFVFTKHADQAGRIVQAAAGARQLIGDVDGHPISSTWVEEPYTHRWPAARALLPIYGAIIAATGFPQTRRSATGITAQDWRQTLHMPARASKEEAIQRARDWILTFAQPELAFNLSEHAAEALLIALAGRHLTWQHHAGTAA